MKVYTGNIILPSFIYLFIFSRTKYSSTVALKMTFQPLGERKLEGVFFSLDLENHCARIKAKFKNFSGRKTFLFDNLTQAKIIFRRSMYKRMG